MDDDVKKLIDNILTAGKNNKVIILAPTRDDNHFRIYCHGGEIGDIPNTKRGQYKFADEHYYLEFDKQDKKTKTGRKDTIIKEDFKVLDDIKQKTKDSKQGKEDIYLTGRYVKEYLPAICRAALTRWNGQERDIQNEIIFDSINNPKPFLACDMEYTIPVAKGSNDKNKNDDKKPEFDIVVVNGIKREIGFIELKSNEGACIGETSGIDSHFNDMLAMFGKIKEREIKEVISRINLLVEAGIINRKIKIEQETSKWNIFLGFLFVPDAKRKKENSFGKVDVKKILNRTKVNEKITNALTDKLIGENSIRFLWAQSPKEVDFSEMRTWDEFMKD